MNIEEAVRVLVKQAKDDVQEAQDSWGASAESDLSSGVTVSELQEAIDTADGWGPASAS